MTMWIITAVDTSDTADGKARVIGVYANKTTALSEVRKDMDYFIGDANGMELNINYDKMSISSVDGNYGCEWNVEEVTIPKYNFISNESNPN